MTDSTNRKREEIWEGALRLRAVHAASYRAQRDRHLRGGQFDGGRGGRGIEIEGQRSSRIRKNAGPDDGVKRHEQPVDSRWGVVADAEQDRGESSRGCVGKWVELTCDASSHRRVANTLGRIAMMRLGQRRSR